MENKIISELKKSFDQYPKNNYIKVMQKITSLYSHNIDLFNENIDDLITLLFDVYIESNLNLPYQKALQGSRTDSPLNIIKDLKEYYKSTKGLYNFNYNVIALESRNEFEFMLSRLVIKDKEIIPSPIKLADSCMYLGVLYSKLEDKLKAIEYFSHSLDYNPMLATSYYNIALLIDVPENKFKYINYGYNVTYDLYEFIKYYEALADYYVSLNDYHTALACYSYCGSFLQEENLDARMKKFNEMYHQTLYVKMDDIVLTFIEKGIPFSIKEDLVQMLIEYQQHRPQENFKELIDLYTNLEKFNECKPLEVN